MNGRRDQKTTSVGKKRTSRSTSRDPAHGLKECKYFIFLTRYSQTRLEFCTFELSSIGRHQLSDRTNKNAP